MAFTAEEKRERERKAEGFIQHKVAKKISYKRMPLKKQKAFKEKIRRFHGDYTFLQYLLPIIKWAYRNHNISLTELMVLLYIHPINVIGYNDFSKEVKKLGIQPRRIWTKLREEGYLTLWAREQNNKYYAFSDKGSTLVARIYNMILQEEEIPMSGRRNVIVRSKDKKDRELVELFKVFNQKVRQNVEQKKENSQ